MKKPRKLLRENENFYDYIYTEYTPKVPWKGKMRSSELLFATFEVAKCSSEFYSLVDVIKKAIGENRTVWGVKQVGEEMLWEFYFYNYYNDSTRVHINDLLNVISPFVKFELASKKNFTNYFMFSIDINKESIKSKRLEGLHLYNGSSYIVTDNGIVLETYDEFFQVLEIVKSKKLEGLHLDNGNCYLVTDNGLVLENYYEFFQVEEIKNIENKIKRSMHFDFEHYSHNEILIPELIGRKDICVANKSRSDGIYFSGLDIQQFRFFLDKFNCPLDLIEFVDNSVNYLDYLQFDVGFDFKIVNGELFYPNSGFYGTF